MTATVAVGECGYRRHRNPAGPLLAFALAVSTLTVVGGLGGIPSQRMALHYPAGLIFDQGATQTSLGSWGSPNLAVWPNVICAVSAPECTAGVTRGQVTLSASVPGNGTPPDWPAVQVVFLLETNPWDGVFDNASPDNYSFPCHAPDTFNYLNWPVCLESNAVPMCVAHAGVIAENI